MPIIKSAKKAARQTVKRTEHNKQLKKDIKQALKSFKAKPTAETLAKAQSEFDKAAKKGLIKKNTASRRKANLHKIAKAAGVSLGKSGAKAATKASEKQPATENVEKAPAKKSTAEKPAAKKTTAKKTSTEKTK